MPVIASSATYFFLVTIPIHPCLLKLQSAVKALLKLTSSRLKPQQIWLHIVYHTFCDVQRKCCGLIVPEHRTDKITWLRIAACTTLGCSQYAVLVPMHMLYTHLMLKDQGPGMAANPLDFF